MTKVLIIDNHKLVGAAMALVLLKEFDFHYIHILDVNEAMEKFRSEEFDIIIFNIKLEQAFKEDSNEARILKLIESNIPVIILSDNDSEELQIKCYTLGADQFISTKNFSLPLTLLKIRNLIKLSVNLK